MSTPDTLPPAPAEWENIAPELKALPQWVLWRFQGRGGKPTKVPYDARTGRPAKSDDPTTWAPYDVAVDVYRKARGKYDGIGFEFADGGPYAGLDFDNSIDPATGEHLPWAKELLPMLGGSYGEISPSGNGAKYITRDELPPDPHTGERSGKNVKGFGPDGTGGIECYSWGRFFAMTGRRPAWCSESVRESKGGVADIYLQLCEIQHAKAMSAPPESAAEVPADGVPVMVTAEMNARLLGKGYAQADIDAMTPQQAWDAASGPDALPVAPPPRQNLAGYFDRPGLPPSPKMSAVERCLAYCEKTPDSISGSGGHKSCFRWACECRRFGLNAEESRSVLERLSATKSGGEPWSPREIEHKIRSAEKFVPADQVGIRLRQDRPGWGGSNGTGYVGGALQRAAAEFSAGANGNGQHTTPAADATIGAAAGTPASGATPPVPAADPAPPALDIMFAGDLVDAYPYMRPFVISNILRQGETANIIAAPKMKKTYLVHDLALCVATGRTWLGLYDTDPGPVLLIDNELHPETLASRIKAIASARGIPRGEWSHALRVLPLRGRLIDLKALAPTFKKILKGSYRLIIVDALYRALPVDVDENSNGQITQVYNLLDAYADGTGASMITIHHASKGAQGSKSITDMGSGAGAQSRAVDAHIALREHQMKDVAVMDVAPRSTAPVPRRAFEWHYPTWHVIPEDKIDVDDLKPDRPTRKKAPATGTPGAAGAPESPPAEPWTVERFVADCITERPEVRDAIILRAEGIGMPTRLPPMMLKAAEAAGLIFRHPDPADKRVARYATKAPELFEPAPATSPPETPAASPSDVPKTAARSRRKRAKGA